MNRGFLSGRWFHDALPALLLPALLAAGCAGRQQVLNLENRVQALREEVDRESAKERETAARVADLEKGRDAAAERFEGLERQCLQLSLRLEEMAGAIRVLETGLIREREIIEEQERIIRGLEEEGREREMALHEADGRRQADLEAKARKLGEQKRILEAQRLEIEELQKRLRHQEEAIREILKPRG